MCSCVYVRVCAYVRVCMCVRARAIARRQRGGSAAAARRCCLTVWMDSRSPLRRRSSLLALGGVLVGSESPRASAFRRMRLSLLSHRWKGVVIQVWQGRRVAE